MIEVKFAKIIDSYKIKIEFSNGTKGVVNLYETFRDDHREIFNELIDEKKFKDFDLKLDTIVWSNGLDLSPEFLYSIIDKKDTEGGNRTPTSKNTGF